MIGAPLDDVEGDNAGTVYVFDLSCAPNCVRGPEWICDGDVDADADGQVNPVDSPGHSYFWRENLLLARGDHCVSSENRLGSTKKMRGGGTPSKPSATLSRIRADRTLTEP